MIQIFFQHRRWIKITGNNIYMGVAHDIYIYIYNITICVCIGDDLFQQSILYMNSTRGAHITCALLTTIYSDAFIVSHEWVYSIRWSGVSTCCYCVQRIFFCVRPINYYFALFSSFELTPIYSTTQWSTHGNLKPILHNLLTVSILFS